MQLREDLQLQTVIRALTEVVMPAVDSGNALAVEQLQVVIGMLHLLAARLPLRFRYDCDELARLLELCKALSANEDSALARASVAGAAVLARAQADPAEVLQAIRELRSLSGALITAIYRDGDEASRTWKEQGLKGQLVLTTSANAVVAKKGSVAYDCSKAAANHLVRELAIELAPIVRVNGVAPATVVQGSAMFPRDRVIGSLAKYNIPYTDDEATESLVKKLAQFYADRTLTKAPITPADQAEAYFLLVSQRLSKTTGQIITVDGGLHEAFLR